MSILNDLRDERDELKRCFNCSKKFSCQDAITGKYDPCEIWTNKVANDPKEVS